MEMVLGQCWKYVIRPPLLPFIFSTFFQINSFLNFSSIHNRWITGGLNLQMIDRVDRIDQNPVDLDGNISKCFRCVST